MIKQSQNFRSKFQVKISGGAVTRDLSDTVFSRPVNPQVCDTTMQVGWRQHEHYADNSDNNMASEKKKKKKRRKHKEDKLAGMHHTSKWTFSSSDALILPASRK
ncbi:hypothetical protein INR49_028218 [Caranx melampygus]|nr:hypothetical protein INR49_028218 [Caranx melampygus]